MARDPNISPEEKEKALAFSKVYEESLKRLPDPKALPKKVPGPHRMKLRGKGGRLGRTSPEDLRKRAELARLMRTPSIEEEEAPSTLRVKKWKKEPKATEFFKGREHNLVGVWPIDDIKQEQKFRRAFRQYKEARYEVDAAQWGGNAYLYARPTKASGRAGEFVRERLPSKESFGPTRRFKIPFSRSYGSFKRVDFYETLGDAVTAQNNLRQQGFSTQMFRYRKRRVRGKTEVGHVLYARHVKEPRRRPVVGGGETGRMSPRQWKEVKKKYRAGGLEVGDKMERWVDGKKTVLHRDMDLTASFDKVSKRYDKLRKQGYPATLKSYTSHTGVTYYTIFKGEKKTKKRAEEYKKLKKKKLDVKMVEAAPRWPKEERPAFVVPSKPHPNAVLIMGESATDPEGQRAIIGRKKDLKEQGVDTEVVFGTDVTHLYAVPSEGQEKVVLPRTVQKKQKKRPRPKAIYGTVEYWKARGVDIEQIEHERFVERVRRTPRRRISIIASQKRRRLKK